MVITLGPELETALNDAARRQGLPPEEVALNALRERLLHPAPPSPSAPAFEPRDEWERRLFAAASDCGVSLSNEAVSSEGIYD